MFPLVKIRLTFRALQSMNFPAYAGSSLRGAFGKSLRRISCLAKRENCAQCAAAASCPYVGIFENGYITAEKSSSEEIPNPYVIEPLPLGSKSIGLGETFCINFIVFGSAVAKISYILLAWVKTENLGFTTERAHARLIKAEQLKDGEPDILLYDFENSEAETGKISPLCSFPPEKEISSLRIVLKTPLRIQRAGHPLVPDQLTARDFFISLLRRQQNMAKHHITEYDEVDFKKLLPEINNISMVNADLHWFDWARYSSRQKKKIALGGIMGSFNLDGNLKKLYPYLKMGEFFHLGKSAVLGMGKYEIEEKI